MFPLDIILSNLQAIVAVVIAVAAAFFGINYVRRGKKIDNLERVNAVHGLKDSAQHEQAKIDKSVKEKLNEVDNAKSDDVLDKLNDLDK